MHGLEWKNQVRALALIITVSAPVSVSAKANTCWLHLIHARSKKPCIGLILLWRLSFLFAFILSLHSFFLSLAKDLSILPAFQKTNSFVDLFYCLLSSISFTSGLIFVISLPLLTLGLVCSFYIVLLSINLDYI